MQQFKLSLAHRLRVLNLRSYLAAYTNVSISRLSVVSGIAQDEIRCGQQAECAGLSCVRREKGLLPARQRRWRQRWCASIETFMSYVAGPS